LSPRFRSEPSIDPPPGKPEDEYRSRELESDRHPSGVFGPHLAEADWALAHLGISPPENYLTELVKLFTKYPTEQGFGKSKPPQRTRRAIVPDGHG
jgi:hypothetical protein